MNPGWTEGMPDWNKTTECVQWDQHYVSEGVRECMSE
jgi:hypothetical protein